jgi:hypothetical protein
MENLFEILINEGINKKDIQNDGNVVWFAYKKIKYFVQIEGDGLLYGPNGFKNEAVSSDYLHENYEEYGTINDFSEFVYDVVRGDRFGELYKITELLQKIEFEIEDTSIDFGKLITHMFLYE